MIARQLPQPLKIQSRLPSPPIDQVPLSTYLNLISFDIIEHLPKTTKLQKQPPKTIQIYMVRTPQPFK